MFETLEMLCLKTLVPNNQQHHRDAQRLTLAVGKTPISSKTMANTEPSNEEAIPNSTAAWDALTMRSVLPDVK